MEYKTHARPELHAPTPPLEALKVVLSEIATGTRRGKVVALVDVRRAYFYAPARGKVMVELPPEDYQPGDKHMCGLLRYGLYGTRDAAQNWEEELATTLSSLKLTRGSACSCVWRGHTKGEHSVATVHGDDKIQTLRRDDRDRPQRTDENDPDSHALANGDITRYRALVARISYLSQDRPDLKFCVNAGMLCNGRANDARHGTRQEDRTIPRWKAEGEVLVPPAAEVWTKKQQVVALSSAESGLYAEVKTASEGLEIQRVAMDLGISCLLNLHLDASAAVWLVNRRGQGNAKHVDMQNLWIQEASKSGQFTTKKVGTNVHPADFMTKPLAKPKIEQLMGIMGYEFTGDEVEGSVDRNVAVMSAKTWRPQASA